jgi:hypothetical protein
MSNILDTIYQMGQGKLQINDKEVSCKNCRHFQKKNNTHGICNGIQFDLSHITLAKCTVPYL